jgi:hypothetical protein
MKNSSMNNLNNKNKNPIKEVLYHVYDSEDPGGFAYP